MREMLEDLWESPWQRIPDLHAVSTLVGCALLWLVMWRDEDSFIFILDHANLMFHEAGHPIYGILGSTLALYGGTLGQLTFPAVVAVSGWLRRHAVMAATGVVWLGQNLVNIARYVADARAQELPLIGGGEHDWAQHTQHFSAEIAQIAAAQPDAIFTFLPGGLGINFVKQWAQSGLKGKIAFLSASTADGIGLPAMGEAATGVIAGTFWGPDFKNAANERFVKEFEAKFKRIPSQYAAQSYDAALLLDSAIAKVKGNVSDKDAFRAALKAADFQSVRGSFKFGTNHFPVQDLHVFEAYKDDKGRMNLKTIATPQKASVDAYAGQCAMK